MRGDVIGEEKSRRGGGGGGEERRLSVWFATRVWDSIED